MQFKHPEILYALFLLLIPIFIHLFQLRRFQKVAFTNVAFLKKVTIQTRKSSQLKKWLTLIMRLLALACIIIAFAQPFTASKIALNTEKETVVYIDNSFSMQTKGAKGPILERALQDLFNQNNGTEKISWFTNNSERKNTTQEDFKNEILSVEYSQNQLTPNQVLLKANQLFSNEKGVLKRLVFLSDFQQKEAFPSIPEDLAVDAVQLKPVKISNISIDSAYIASKNASLTQLKVNVSTLRQAQGNEVSEIPLSLYNNEKLIAKTAVDFSQNTSSSVTFDIDNSTAFIGKLEINEPNISFDNQLYFSINKPGKIKVLAINEADGSFLQRLFEKEEFQFKQQTFKTLNYNEILDQNFIVLNELKEIPASLATALKSFSDEGGSILIIPVSEIDLNSYNNYLLTMTLGTLSEEKVQEKKITKIVFSHPLFKDVFEKEVANFQYPKVNSFYDVSSKATPAISFEDNHPFLLQKNKTYLFTAPINKENSNFQNSPLVVPTIYNMALQSLPLPRLYYTIGQQTEIAVPIQLGQDEILTVKNSAEQFIPLQQTKANYVLMTTTEEPAKAGNYQIMKKNEFLENISFNYSRSESELQYLNPEDWEGVEVYSSVEALFDSIEDANAINSFWKWFAIFALLFLLFEMLILKFYK
ncbi:MULTISPECIES: BatA domain-containing protein [Aequorivita]|uniref:BatA domain-containing protein n=1 Tax=Aequorivita iocasae TaxID=2803865 RepID=A0ABX7DRU6_9FLAO|nr:MULTISPECIES: BatA domain-containing protein [Aequorivita]QQX76336.1 BatA domain-containing protein [Aequorivita iocasae]UCA55801.1 BatA domain-containing protein [Aequorivita sp. F7]